MELASVWPSARHNDCSREILQCGCNLSRSPVVLPTAFPSEQPRRRPSVCSWEMDGLFNILNKSLPGRSSMPLEGQFLCCALSVLAIALYKNFPQNVLVSSSFWSPRKRRHGPCMYYYQIHVSWISHNILHRIK